MHPRTPEIDVSLLLPRGLLLAIGRAAIAAGQRPSDLVRDALTQAFAPVAVFDTDTVGTLFRSIAASTGWLDLQRRLRRLGFVLRADCDGDAFLHDWPSDRRIISLTEAGYRLRDLTIRFREPFPARIFRPGAAARPDIPGRAARKTAA
jgi:hypothetical protein